MSFLGVSGERQDGSGVAVNKCLTGAPPEATAPSTSPPGPVEEPGGFGGVTLVLVILVGGGLWYYREQR